MKPAIEPTIEITRQTPGSIPPLPFAELKDKILGKRYHLSMLFPDTKTSCKLHMTYKGKGNPVNVLSFPLEKNQGEIVITLNKARTEAKLYGRSYYDHLIALYIHGLVHLKGFDHGKEMDQQEEHWMNYYKKHYQPTS